MKDLFRFPGTATTAALGLAFLYLPIVALLILSFNENDLITIWTGFSTRWYKAVFSNADMLQAARNSLIVAATATIVGTAAATAATLGVARARAAWKAAVEGLLGLPILVPEIVTAVALLLLFVFAGIELGLLTVIIAHTVFCIPFAYYPIRARLAGLDPALSEAAADLYADPPRRFLRVELPLLAPGIMAGAMLAFISSLGDFVITYFVAGPGATTLPVYIFGMIRIGITPEVNALSAVMLLASILLITIAFLLGRYSDKQSNKGKTS